MEQSPSIRSLTDRPWRLRDDNANEWLWGNRARRRHDLASWLEIEIPAGVQECLLRAGQIPEPYRDLNTRLAEWVEHRDWVYALDFELAPPEAGGRVFLEFDSVDDHCRVYLNGKPAGEHEGPGAPFDLEIGGLLQAEGGNQLIVVVDAVPPEEPQTGWTEHTHALKGRMGYGWDFAPRLVKTGILGDVGLRFTGQDRLRNLWARPRLSEDRRSASVAMQVEVDGPPGAEVRFRVLSDGRQVAEAAASAGEDGVAAVSVEIAEPRVWWPNGMGEQPLYTLEAEVAGGSDRASATFGLRELRWVQTPEPAEGEWPLVLEVNGRRVFQKGWNWVPADAMGGPRADEQMRPLLQMARDAHVNVIRCWGGADPESRAFYEECDRLGLLVWQEFPLSSAGISNQPPADPDYLDRLEKFARVVVAARRNHPSLALWGGGNELSRPDGEPLTMEHPYPQRLAGVIGEADPDRDFRPSSPLGPHGGADPEHKGGALWDVHGPWEYSERYPGPQYWRINDVDPILHSELGLPGEASLETQEEWLSPEHRSRRPENPARGHHAGWWEHGKTLERVFGAVADDELAVLASQWLQAEGLRYYIEETRRRWPHSAGIYPWQLNEPWPMVVCTSAVEYGGTPKLAYYAVRQAYRPRSATARYEGLKLAPGEPLRASIWIHNDEDEAEAPLMVTLSDLQGDELARTTPQTVRLPANSTSKQLDLELSLPAGFSGVMVLEVNLDGLTSRYLFSNLQEEHLRPALDYPELLSDTFPAEG